MDTGSVLIREAQEGNWASFEKLVNIYKDRVYSIALMLTKDSVEAEEVAHLAFLKLGWKISKFNFRSSFSTWLYRLVHNTFYDYLRKKKRNSRDTVSINNLYSLNSGKDPYELLQEKETAETVRRALEKIPEKLRLAVIYYDLQGMSYREIASIIKRPVGTVKSRLARGRGLLKEELGNKIGVTDVKKAEEDENEMREN